MEQYNNCTKLQKEILDKMFVYFGFNEVTTFEEYITYFFKHVRYGTSFDCILNHFLSRIVDSFWSVFKDYRNGYIKFFWIDHNDMMKHLEVGSDVEYDPKGLLRHHVIRYYDHLISGDLL